MSKSTVTYANSLHHKLVCTCYFVRGAYCSEKLPLVDTYGTLHCIQNKSKPIYFYSSLRSVFVSLDTLPFHLRESWPAISTSDYLLFLLITIFFIIIQLTREKEGHYHHNIII